MENVLPSSHEKFKQKTFEPLPICAISLSTLKKIWTCQTGWVQGEDHDPCPRINRGFSGPLSSLIFKGILYLKSTNQTNLNRFGSIFCCIFHKIDPPFFFYCKWIWSLACLEAWEYIHWDWLCSWDFIQPDLNPFLVFSIFRLASHGYVKCER